MTEKLSDLRRDYGESGLDLPGLDVDPFRQFAEWFDDAKKANIYEPNAMTLATADDAGKVHARIVLLKAADERGFVFFTNYRSDKGEQLLLNHHASLVFFWDRLHRQVRIEGQVEKISHDETADYFHSRPRESQLGAWASPQSDVIASRNELERRYDEAEKRFANHEVDVPPYWGGYRVLPSVMEFWQGRTSRLHDRFRFRRPGVHDANVPWVIERLAP